MPRKKKCHNNACEFEYSKITPQHCPLCKAFITNVVNDKPKKVKVVKENNSETVHVGEGIYSVKYWQLNRCFVKINSDKEDINFCTKKECSDLRGLAVRNVDTLHCPHVKQVERELKADLVELR